jgi:hypothetical protein
LTTPPNAAVAPIHPKAMPVILTTTEESDVWMRGPGALHHQRPQAVTAGCGRRAGRCWACDQVAATAISRMIVA